MKTEQPIQGSDERTPSPQVIAVSGTGTATGSFPRSQRELVELSLRLDRSAKVDRPQVDHPGGIFR